MMWLLLLPIRLAFFLVFALLIALPLLLLRFAIKATAALLFLPFVLLILLACLAFGLVAATVALLLPLLPLAVIGFCLWILLKRTSPPALGGA